MTPSSTSDPNTTLKSVVPKPIKGAHFRFRHVLAAITVILALFAAIFFAFGLFLASEALSFVTIFLGLLQFGLLFRSKIPVESVTMQDQESESNSRPRLRRSLLSIAVITIAAAFLTRGFLSFGQLAFWDFLGVSKVPVESLSVWSSDALGYPKSPVLYPVLGWLLGSLNAELGTVLLLIVPVFTGCIAMFYAARRVECGQTAAAVAAILYMANPAIQSWFLQGHIGMVWGYALMPLVFGNALEITETKENHRRWRLVLFLSFITALSAHLQIHFLILDPLLAGLVILTRRSHVAVPQALTGFLGFVVLSLLSLSPYALLFFALQDNGNAIQPSSIHVFALSGGAEFRNLVRLVGDYGGGLLKQLGYYSPGVKNASGFGLWIVALFTPLLASTNQQRLLAPLWGMALSGLWLATGTNYLGKAYAFLASRLPPLILMRESSKFLVLVTLGLCLLFAISFDGLSKALRPKLGALGLSFLMLLPAGLVYSYGHVASGDYGIRSVHSLATISEEYDRLGAWLDAQEGLFRVAVVPYDDFIFRTWRHVSTRPVFGLDYFALREITPDSYQFLLFVMSAVRERREQAAFLLGLAGVRYVILRRPAETHRNPPSHTSEVQPQPQDWEALIHRNGMRLVQAFPPFYVYENHEFRGFAYLARSVSMVFAERRALLQDRKLLVPAVFHLERVPTNLFGQICEPTSVQKASAHLLVDAGRGILSTDLYWFAEAVDPSEVDSELGKHWITSDSFEYVHPGMYARGASTLAPKYAVTSGIVELLVRLLIPDQGPYEVWVRGAALDRPATLEVGEGTLAGRAAFPVGTFAWKRVGVTGLGGGWKDFGLRSTGPMALDQLLLIPHHVLSPAYQAKCPEQLSRKEGPRETGGEVRLRKVWGGYLVDVRRETPALLVLAEGFHPAWVASDGIRTYMPIKVNSFSTGFVLPSGDRQITVTFRWQRWVDYSFMFATVIGTLCILGAVFVRR